MSGEDIKSNNSLDNITYDDNLSFASDFQMDSVLTTKLVGQQPTQYLQTYYDYDDDGVIYAGDRREGGERWEDTENFLDSSFSFSPISSSLTHENVPSSKNFTHTSTPTRSQANIRTYTLNNHTPPTFPSTHASSSSIPVFPTPLESVPSSSFPSAISSHPTTPPPTTIPIPIPTPTPTSIPTLASFSYSSQPEYHRKIDPYIRLINTNIYIYNTNIILFKKLIQYLSVEYTRISNYTSNITSQILQTISNFFRMGKYNYIYYNGLVSLSIQYLKDYAILLANVFSYVCSYVGNVELTLKKHAWLLIRAIWAVYHVRVFSGNLPDNNNVNVNNNNNSMLVRIISKEGSEIIESFLDILFKFSRTL